MTIRRPTQDQLAEIAADFGFSLTPVEIAAYAEAALPGVQLYEAVDAMSDNLSPVGYPRLPAIARRGRKTNTTLGMSKCGSTARPEVGWPVNGSRSRTAFVWLAFR